MSAFGDLIGGTARLRRSVVDPETGNIVATQPPMTLGELGGAYVDLLASRARDAITAPRDAYRGDLQVFDLATGHVSPEAMERAGGMAGLAMTGGFGGVAAQAGEAVLGVGPVRRLTYDSPLFGRQRVTKVAAEQQAAERAAQAAEMRTDPARAGAAGAIQGEADALSALLPKFDQDLPRGRPFQPQRVIDVEDGRAVRVREDGDARTYRVLERGENGALSRPRGHVDMTLQPDGRWRTDMLEVQPAHQGKGLASTLYRAVEQDTGRARVPSGQLLPDGYAFWRARDPEAVRFHQPIGDQFWSPRRITEALDAGTASPEMAATLRAALDRVPAEGKTAAALARQHHIVPAAVAGGAAAAALAAPGDARAAETGKKMSDPFDDLLAAHPAPAIAPKAVAADPFEALLAANPKPAPAADARAAGPANAAARGIVNGVPIIGPALLSGIDQADSAVRALTNDTAYSDELAQARQYGERMKTEHPIATTAGEIVGGVAGTAPLVAAAPAAFGVGAAPLAIRAGASAVTNGVIGGADGAARSGGDLEAIEKGAKYGAIGGLLAPAAGLAGKVAEAVASKIKPAAAVPGIDELKAAARAAYDRADAAGVQIGQPSFQAAIHDIGQSLRSAGLDRTIHPKATAAMARLEEAVGTAPTLREFETLRQVAKSAAGSIEPSEKRIGSILVDKLDGFLERLKPGDLVQGDADAATAALKEARTMWGRARRAEMIEDAMEAGVDRAASNAVASNTDAAIRQNIRSILSSPKKRAGFSGEEIEAMRAVVRGGPVQNLAAKVGRLAPEGAVGLLEAGAAYMHPSIESLAIPAVGYAAKKYAEHAGASGVRRLGDLIRSGGQIPVSPLALPAREAVEPLAVNIFGSAPRVASQRQ